MEEHLGSEGLFLKTGPGNERPFKMAPGGGGSRAAAGGARQLLIARGQQVTSESSVTCNRWTSHLLA